MLAACLASCNMFTQLSGAWQRLMRAIEVPGRKYNACYQAAIVGARASDGTALQKCRMLWIPGTR
jgi:hypothetical protein